MTPERIAELRALAEAATPGPWLPDMNRRPHGVGNDYATLVTQGDALVCDTWNQPFSNADGRFIAAARTALPEALDAIERVRALHEPFKIYGDCGHDHDEDEPGVAYVEEIGWTCEFLYEICYECCAGHRGEQSEECCDEHDHGHGKPICETIAVLDGKP